jgi:DNA-binding transcriptional LysR family regulator
VPDVLRSSSACAIVTLGLLPNFTNTTALRYFYEVARYGSFRLAAEKVRIAASAISRQIQLLEQELGLKLFARGRSGLTLTPAGEALLYRLKKAMNELAIGRSEIDALHGSHRGTVRVGINETVAREFFSAFLLRFRQDHPNIRFEITVANSDQLEEILLRDEIDILIGYAVRVRSGLQQVAAFDLTACITVKKNHVLARKKIVRISDFVDENLIMPSEGSTLREALNLIFSSVSVRPVSTLSTDSFEFMANLVMLEFGIGFQLRLTPGSDPIRKELVYVPIRESTFKQAALACCISDEGTGSAAVSVCLQALRKALDEWSRADGK